MPDLFFVKSGLTLATSFGQNLFLGIAVCVAIAMLIAWGRTMPRHWRQWTRGQKARHFALSTGISLIPFLTVIALDAIPPRFGIYIYHLEGIDALYACALAIGAFFLLLCAYTLWLFSTAMIGKRRDSARYQ